MKSANKTWLQSVKAGLLALVFACIGVLLLALVAKLTGLADSLLPIINQILKAVAVVLGTAIAVKESKLLAKALLGGATFWLLSTLLFWALGGSWHWGQIALDLAIALAAAFVVALVKSRKR